MITLFKAEPFNVELGYEAGDHIPACFSRSLGKYTVHLPKVSEGAGDDWADMTVYTWLQYVAEGTSRSYPAAMLGAASTNT